MKFEDIKGLVITEITGAEAGEEEIFFKTQCGRQFKMFHCQDCCEQVYIESVTGDVNDLLNSPILMAEEVISDANPVDISDASGTWTFYKLATIKGYVDIRWIGQSNGYYSESVDFVEVTLPITP